MKPVRWAQLAWVVGIVWLLGYEVFALFMGYEWTLTAGARDVFYAHPWTGGVLAGFLCWFAVHILIERRKEKRNKKD